MDQILTNFIPYNDPYIVVSWKNPDRNLSLPQEIRSVVEWSGNINMQYPIDLQPNTPYRVTADTSFVIKGWLFKREASQNLPNVLTVTVNSMSVDGDTTDKTGVIYTLNNETLTPPLSII